MADSVLNFEEGDFDSLLPAEGYYEAVIERARFHRSQQGNTTLQVTCQIMGVSPGNDIVADYFVLSGSSERGRAVSRRRLLELYRACGFSRNWPPSDRSSSPRYAAQPRRRSSTVFWIDTITSDTRNLSANI